MFNTIIFAHRGVSQFAPENTLPAFKMAIENNCDGIEFDIQLSKDNIPVIIHDETIDRTSNGKGNVSDFTLSELKNFNFSNTFTEKFKQVPICTLEELFQLIKSANYKGITNLEIKNDKVKYENIEEITLNMINKYNLNSQVLISSFNHDTVKKFRQLSDTIKIAPLYEKHDIPNIKEILNMNAFSANLNYKNLSTEVVKNLQKNNIKIFCYTVNDRINFNNLKSLGINGVFSNDPILLSKQLAISDKRNIDIEF